MFTFTYADELVSSAARVIVVHADEVVPSAARVMYFREQTFLFVCELLRHVVVGPARKRGRVIRLSRSLDHSSSGHYLHVVDIVAVPR